MIENLRLVKVIHFRLKYFVSGQNAFSETFGTFETFRKGPSLMSIVIVVIYH